VITKNEDQSNHTQETDTFSALLSPKVANNQDIQIANHDNETSDKSEKQDVIQEFEPIEKKAKADPCLKKILRGLRKEVKDQFVAVYGKRYFHWVDHKLRKRVKFFFTTKT